MTVISLADARPDYLRLKAIEEQIKVLQEQRAILIDKLAPIGNAFFEYEGNHYTAKIVAASRLKVTNLIDLKKNDPATFDAITKTTLNEAKLRELIEQHKLPEAVEVETNYNKPYIQVRQVRPDGVELKDVEDEIA